MTIEIGHNLGQLMEWGLNIATAWIIVRFLAVVVEFWSYQDDGE